MATTATIPATTTIIIATSHDCHETDIKNKWQQHNIECAGTVNFLSWGFQRNVCCGYIVQPVWSGGTEQLLRLGHSEHSIWCGDTK